MLVSAGATVAAAAAWATWDYPLRPSRFSVQALERLYRALPVPYAPPVAAGLVRRGIERAVSYIQRAQRPSGQFTYLVNLDPQLPVEPGYSLLRHAGTVYALAMAQAVQPDPQTLTTMRAAVSFMRVCCLRQVPSGEGQGITEPAAVVHLAGPTEFKLGGAGLGLVATASLERLQPGTVPLEEMRALSRFGRSMMRWNGEFYARYVPARGGPQQPGMALFYPGEMVLGWLMLDEIDPTPHLVDWSVRALGLLARQRAASGAAPADHWALLATARLLQRSGRDRVAVAGKALLDHALQICHTVLEEGVGEPAMPSARGSLVSAGAGEVTPTSTRLEGLLAALSVMPPTHPILPHLRAAAHRGIDFVLRAQVTSGAFVGGIPHAAARVLDDGQPETKRFNAAATEIRIDYVQHALSAMVQYLPLAAPGPPPGG